MSKVTTLVDYPEFSETAERLSKLRLRKSGTDEQIKVLTAQIHKINSESENQAASDLVSNPDAEFNRHKMRDLSAQVSELRAESDTLQIAITQVRNQLGSIRQKLLPEISEQFRPQHQKIVQEYINLGKKIYAAQQANISFMQEVGAATGLNPSEILPAFHLRTFGSESDGYSFLGLLLNKARSYGYEIS